MSTCVQKAITFLAFLRARPALKPHKKARFAGFFVCPNRVFILVGVLVCSLRVEISAIGLKFTLSRFAATKDEKIARS